MASTQRTRAPANIGAEKGTNGPAAAASPARTPSADAVARRAYEIWRDSGGAHGNDQAHWFQAERELRGRAAPR